MSEMTVRHVAIMQRLFLLALRQLDWSGDKLASRISAVLMAHEFKVSDNNDDATSQGRNHRRNGRRDNEENKDTTKSRLFAVKSMEQLRDFERSASVSTNLSTALDLVRHDMIFLPPGLQATVFVDMVTSTCASVSVSVTYSVSDIVANMQSKKCGNFTVSLPPNEGVEGIDAAILTPASLGGADSFDDYQKLLVGRLRSDVDPKPSYVLSPLRPAGSHGPTFKARFAGLTLIDLERTEAPAAAPQNDHDFIHSLRAGDIASVETAGQVHALADSDDKAKRFAAAGHPLLGDEDFMTLLAEGNVDVDNVLASRSDLAPPVLKTLVSRFNPETLRVLLSAHNERTIVEIEESLDAIWDDQLSRIVNAASHADVISEFVSKTSSVQLISRIVSLSTNKTSFLGIARRENEIGRAHV